jgi:hypothetical protein
VRSLQAENGKINFLGMDNGLGRSLESVMSGKARQFQDRKMRKVIKLPVIRR